MQVRSSSSRRPVAFLTALLTLIALVVPLINTAGASHGAGANPTVITLAADDSAGVNTCNEITVTATSSGIAAEGETLDIAVVQSDTDDTARDLAIGFCDPDGPAGTSSNLAGVPALLPGAGGGSVTGSGANPFCDIDDNNNTTNGSTYTDAGFPAANQPATNIQNAPAGGGCGDNGGVGISSVSSGTEFPALIHDECITGNAGECSFGITSNGVGTATTTVWFDTALDEVPTAGGPQTDTVPDAADPRDFHVKTWFAGGTAAVTSITCTPPTDANPEVTQHQFQCTTSGANGPLAGITVSFDVTAGPNAEEVAPTTCPGVTNAQGQTAAVAAETPPNSGQASGGASAACNYSDFPGVQSPLGTDTITAFVNSATAQPGQPVPTAGPDPGEPQTTISKLWYGAGRTIDCEPETAANEVGTSHLITCTVRDRAGNPVPNVNVTALTRSGPGAITPAGPQATNSLGQVTYTTATATFSATGDQTLRFAIQGSPGAPAGPAQVNPAFAGAGNVPESTTGAGGAATECTQGAGVPAGATAGICFDDVIKTWLRQGATAPPTGGPGVCNDGLDNENDGTIDEFDPGCSSEADTTETRTRRPRSNVTIAGRFRGQVVAGGAGNNECHSNRRIRIRRVRGGTVARTTTNARGNYRVRRPNVRRGRYFATAARATRIDNNPGQVGHGDTLRCRAGRSPTTFRRRR